MEQEKCLHCGEDKPRYCEGCYQKLVAENLRLQAELAKQKDYYESLIQDVIQINSDAKF